MFSLPVICWKFHSDLLTAQFPYKSLLTDLMFPLTSLTLKQLTDSSCSPIRRTVHSPKLRAFCAQIPTCPSWPTPFWRKDPQFAEVWDFPPRRRATKRPGRRIRPLRPCQKWERRKKRRWRRWRSCTRCLKFHTHHCQVRTITGYFTLLNLFIWVQPKQM